MGCTNSTAEETNQEAPSTTVQTTEKEPIVKIPEQVKAPAKPVPATATKENAKIPAMKMGMVKKQGGSYKTWKTRHFVLQKGVLKYYVSESSAPPNYGNELKGEISLKGQKTTDLGNTQVLIEPRNPASEDRKLLIEIADARERAKWTAAFNEHIQYASAH
jgi:hypothetical protein